VTLVLTVTRSAWDSHIDSVASKVPGLVPVVKGNGYGFGREWLAARAATLGPYIAVGTAEEVSAVPAERTPVVLTPLVSPRPGLRPDAIVTVGSLAHLDASAGRPILVKVRSSMNRHGCAPVDVTALVASARRVGCSVVGLSIHPPLAGDHAGHVREITDILTLLDTSVRDLPVWVSHVDGEGLAELRRRFADREWFLRLGTSLWHGDKSMFHLEADVLDARRVRRGERAGYRLATITDDATLLVIGCGTAHGVAPLDGGLSPFHFARRRLTLVEPPHMHTSMVLVSADSVAPNIGDRVDVQRPLIHTTVDRIDWV
jgi:alanine racemase